MLRIPACMSAVLQALDVESGALDACLIMPAELRKGHRHGPPNALFEPPLDSNGPIPSDWARRYRRSERDGAGELSAGGRMTAALFRTVALTLLYKAPSRENFLKSDYDAGTRPAQALGRICLSVFCYIQPTHTPSHWLVKAGVL